MVPHAPVTSIMSESEVFITHFCQLSSTHYTAVQIKNCLKSTFVTKVATVYQKICIVLCVSVNGAAPISFHLKSKVFITLHCQPGSAHYTTVSFKKYLCNQRAIPTINFAMSLYITNKGQYHYLMHITAMLALIKGGLF